jgi:hypothetical protein
VRQLAIYERDPYVVVHAQAGVYGDTWFAIAPFIRLPIDCVDSDLEAAIRAALDASSNVDAISPIGDVSHGGRPLLELFGTKSRREFHQAMRSVTVGEDDDGRFTIWPMRNLGPRDGFDFGDPTTLPAGTHAAFLTKEIRSALGRADPGDGGRV